jgi:hypothetical protein
MLIPVAVAVVVITIVVVVVGASTTERPSFSTTAVVTLGGGVVVLIAIVALVIGRGSRATDHDSPDDVPQRAEAEQEPQPAATTPVLRRPIDLVIGTEKVGAGFGVTGSVLDELSDHQIRLVAVATSAPVILRECAIGAPGAPRRCAAGTPAGSIDSLAVGLVELQRVIDVPGGAVDCAIERCALIATTPNGRKDVGSVPMVFGRRATLPVVRVNPTRDVHPGDDVEVRLDGLSPRESVTVTWCAPPGPVAPGACGRPAAELALRADATGGAVGTLRVPGDEVGADRARCGPRARCAVAVLGAIVSPTPAEVGFAGVPGPDLGSGQLVAGLVAAGLLAIVAALLVRRRPDEHPDDPFWGVSLDVPEWEGIDITIDEDELAGV